VRPLRRQAPATAADRIADPLARAIDYGLLISVGWDPATKTLAPDRRHPLLGYSVCRVAGCESEAWDRSGLCGGCRSRFEASDQADVEAFAALRARPKNRSRDRRCRVCRIPGFERPVGTNDLCLSCDGLRRRRRQSVAAYVSGDDRYPPAGPRPGLGTCTVAACGRLTARRQTGLCGAHDGAWRAAGRPDLAAFRASASPCLADRSGRVVLAGLEENVIAEVLYGVQASVAEGRRVLMTSLRGVAGHLRRCGAANVADAVATAAQRTPVRCFLAFTADRVALARSDPETEQEADVWDLRLWGAAGRLSFTGGAASPRYQDAEATRAITQQWLKAAAKTWAAEALNTMTAGPVRAVIGAVGLLSEHLARTVASTPRPSAIGTCRTSLPASRAWSELASCRRTGALTASTWRPSSCGTAGRWA
jgi:hypothetical protein